MTIPSAEGEDDTTSAARIAAEGEEDWGDSNGEGWSGDDDDDDDDDDDGNDDDEYYEEDDVGGEGTGRTAEEGKSSSSESSGAQLRPRRPRHRRREPGEESYSGSASGDGSEVLVAPSSVRTASSMLGPPQVRQGGPLPCPRENSDQFCPGAITLLWLRAT